VSRSVRFHEFGGPEVLKIEDVVVPDPGPKEVRLRIKAIGLNRSEVLTRSGRAPTKATLPAQLGLEAAGARNGHSITAHCAVLERALRDFMKRQALLVRFRSAQIRGFKIAD
jgi:D-arabinose 1-dehydrogenase-like Zn-dependent alcohol dehydrogenase